VTAIIVNQDSFLMGILNAPSASASEAVKGEFQGRQVQVRAQAQSIPPAPAEPTASAAPTSLEQRQARPANAAPSLVRQARYGALPSTTQVHISIGNAGEVAKARGLPSMGQVIAYGGPAKSYSLLERFMNLFRSDKSSVHYQKTLTGLKAYHEACQTGTAQKAKTRLDELSKMVDRYGQGSDGNYLRTGVMRELRKLIANEQVALTNLATELQGGALPQGASLLHALAFSHAGVSLKEMAGLMDKGLKLDQAAPETLENKRRQPQGYLKFLANLESYHAAGAAKDAGARSDIDLAKQAMALLNKLEISTQRYIHNNSGEHKDDPHTETLNDLRDQIPIERQVLQGLLDELKNGGKLPEGADLSHALAFAREGVSLKDMDRLMAKGLLPNQASDARELLDSERAISLMDKLNHLTPEKKAEIEESGFSENEILLLELSGLGPEGGAEYRRLGIPITHQTIVTQHTDEQRLGHMSRLGAGAFNEVFMARYIGSDGVVKGVFKPLNNTEDGWVAHMIGIDLTHPQIANRNLATQDVARALGFDVVVDCRIGARQDPETQELQLGLVMGRAPGNTACDTPRDHYANPEVRREITKLQLLDHLVGQGDRHGNNYFIDVQKDEKGQTKVKVSGIDNDQCFGKNTLHGNDICHGTGRRRDGFRGTLMPGLIDTDMAAALRSITRQRLSALLNDKLSPAEVDAAHRRLQSLHNHVDQLERRGRVITPSEWNKQSVRRSLLNSSNSYFARDADNADLVF
jgi:hypothetical protein